MSAYPVVKYKKMKSIYFCLGIIVAIVIAKVNPSIGSTGGILRPEITSKYLAVSLLFLSSGLTLPTEALTAAILRWDLHLFIQGFTFVIFPAFVYCLVSVLHYTILHPSLLEGMLILSTMPPPVSSAIILTKAVGGNVAGALFNSAFGSMLGIFLTPSLIILILGSSEVNVPSEQIFKQLFVTVVVPLVIGQIFRNYFLRWLQRQNIPFDTIGQFLIFFIIYTTFCATFSREELKMDPFSLIVSIFLIVCLQLGIMVFLLLTSSGSIFKFDGPDTATIVFCGTHKSLTLGIPVIDIIFDGNPNISFLSIPLLIYNPLQILIGGMMTGLFQDWLKNHENRRRPRLPASCYIVTLPTVSTPSLCSNSEVYHPDHWCDKLLCCCILFNSCMLQIRIDIISRSVASKAL
ncbi:unnamed protein product [Lymnaea stagnalis]|uniref:Sodium/bile acid cotransporter 7 n=1 Tax=Lymnaea stagnalis TaxID=6523 RepID=A0AAV2HZM6_LYMST